MRLPWVSRQLYLNVLRQLARANRRAELAEARLEEERADNRIAERFWANTIIKAKGGYPLQPAAQPTATPIKRQPPPIDAGELRAVRAEALRLGLPPEKADEILAKERDEYTN